MSLRRMLIWRVVFSVVLTGLTGLAYALSHLIAVWGAPLAGGV